MPPTSDSRTPVMEIASPPQSHGTILPIAEPTNRPIQISFFCIYWKKPQKAREARPGPLMPFAVTSFLLRIRRSLLGDDLVRYLVVSCLGDDFLLNQLVLPFIGPPVDDFLSVCIPDTRKLHQILFACGVDIDQIRFLFCRLRLGCLAPRFLILGEPGTSQQK